MTKDELLKLHEELTGMAYTIMKVKNSDYTGKNSSPFKNFQLSEFLGVATAEQGIFTRFLDKVSRIATFITTENLQVKDESFEDSCIDGINYLILLYGQYLSRKGLTNGSADKPTGSQTSTAASDASADGVGRHIPRPTRKPILSGGVD